MSPYLYPPRHAAIAFVLSCACGLPVVAQSDPGNFETVLNVPGDLSSFSGTLFSQTQLNLYNEGLVQNLTAGPYDETSTNIEVNLFGGIADQVVLNTGATLNVFDGATLDTTYVRESGNANFYGGLILDDVQANQDSVVTVYDGVFNAGFSGSDHATLNLAGGSYTFFSLKNQSIAYVLDGDFSTKLNASDQTSMVLAGGRFGSGLEAAGQVTFLGGEFEHDGVPVTALPRGLEGNGGTAELFTGTLSDGSPFILSTEDDDLMFAGRVTLTSAPPPPVDTTPIIISTGLAPDTGLRSGQTLTLAGDATLPERFTIVHATLNIEGGTVGPWLRAAHSEVNISAGAISNPIHAFDGTTIQISGGTIGSPSGSSTVAIEAVQGITPPEGERESSN